MEWVLLSVVTFGATLAAGLVLTYHTQLSSRAMRAVGLVVAVVRWPFIWTWKFLRNALTRTLADRVTNLEQRLDSQESVLRSVQSRLGLRGSDQPTAKGEESGDE
jgi:hypothetical protein